MLRRRPRRGTAVDVRRAGSDRQDGTMAMRRAVTMPEVWRPRKQRAIAWGTSVVAAALLIDVAYTFLDGTRDSLTVVTAAFAGAMLLLWWHPNALAIGLAIPLIISGGLQDARAVVFLMPAVLGVVAATAGGSFVLASLAMSVLWTSLLPVFSPEDAPAVPLIVLLELVAVGIGMSFRFRAIRHERDQERLVATRARLAHQQLLEEQAAERVRRSVARDLHDVVAHSLTIISLQSGVAIFTNDLDKTKEALGRISDASHQALTDLRVMLRLLQSPVYGPGVSGAAEGDSIDDVPRDASTLRLAATGPQFQVTLQDLGYPTTLTMDPRLGELSRGEEITLHRVLQEVTTNVLKHAPQGSPCVIDIAVRVSGEESWAVLRVQNELPAVKGRPGEPGVERPLRLGLLSMRERVESVGGRFHAGPEDGRWVTQAEVPVRLRPEQPREKRRREERDARKDSKRDAGRRSATDATATEGGSGAEG